MSREEGVKHHEHGPTAVSPTVDIIRVCILEIVHLGCFLLYNSVINYFLLMIALLMFSLFAFLFAF